MKDKTYQLLVAKMKEISEVPPQEIGPFTPLYKRFVPYVKFNPWKSALALSIVLTLVLYLFFGIRWIRLISLLQLGF